MKWYFRCAYCKDESIYTRRGNLSKDPMFRNDIINCCRCGMSGEGKIVNYESKFIKKLKKNIISLFKGKEVKK